MGCKEQKQSFDMTHGVNVNFYHDKNNKAPIYAERLDDIGSKDARTKLRERQGLVNGRHLAMLGAEREKACRTCKVSKLKRLLGLTAECGLPTLKVNPAEMCLCPTKGQEIPTAESKSCIDYR